MPALSVTSAMPGCSVAAWRPGDHLQVWHDGTVYDYVTSQNGDEALFQPSTGGQALDGFDPAKPLNVYFNVEAVSGKGEAVFTVKAEQRPGEFSSRLPQWGRIEPGTGFKVKMAPLATVIEMSASASESFRVDRVVLLPQTAASGFTAVSGARINPVSGKITLPRQSGRPVSIGFTTGGADLASRPVFSIIVAGVHPGNPGFVVDGFKGRVNNYRAVILPGKDAGKGNGPCIISVNLDEKKTGISSLQEFEDFVRGLSQGDRHGLKYCNEDGVVCLNADIDLASIAGAGKDWPGIKDLRADFDGRNHTIYGYQISRPGSAAIFASASGSIRNVNFGQAGDYLEVTGGNFSLAAPIAMTTNPNAVVEGCVNRSEVRSGNACTGNVFVGGIVGRTTASLVNCANLGTVSLNSSSTHGTKYAGGIVGNVVGDVSTVSGGIASCVNRGDVTCSSSEKAWVGGIAGRISETAKAWKVEKCTNKGKISISSIEEHSSAISFIGGITAEMAVPVSFHGANHLMKDCRNTGKIFTNADGRISVGGIVGSARKTVLEQCVNEAEVAFVSGMESITGAYVGGIAGVSRMSEIKQCSNASPVQLKLMRKVSALCAAGGICGLQDGSSQDMISSCSNAGDVSLTVNVTGLNAVAGGILAVLAKGGVDSCKNGGTVTAVNELALPDMNCLAGGIAGRVYRVDVSGINHCSNTAGVRADAPFSPSKGLVESGEIVGHYD